MQMFKKSMTAAELIGILKTAGFNEMPMVGGNALFFGSGSSLTCFIPPIRVMKVGV